MSASTEEYLEALYKLTAGNKHASTTTLSRVLRIAPPSVTQMMQKLSKEGYIKYLPYRGAILSAKGYRIAEKITRKHRLLECFLCDVLKIDKDKVHDEACKMEHAISDETARAMCQTLHSPDKCPDDGQLIPACDLGFSSCEECRRWHQDNPGKTIRRKTIVVCIAILKENQQGTISFIRGDERLLRRLRAIGLTPGTKIRVSRAALPDGPIEIIGQGSPLELEDNIARNVFVEKVSG